jgi:rRNA maturation protein Rpf1
LKLLLFNILIGAQRMNRGGYETHQLVNACRANGITDLIIAYVDRDIYIYK